MKDITPEKLNNMTDGEETEEYKAFTEKFKPKKTTDDCYTPENIYEAVADYVAEHYGLKREHFVRPFYPGGDFEAYNYKESDIVVDNPPFSMMARILDFYLSHNIPFFLFCGTLTSFNHLWRQNLTVISGGTTITYNNGAAVRTSFFTNMEPETITRTAPDLCRTLDRIDKENAAKLREQHPKYEYPDHVLTGAQMDRFSQWGVPFSVPRSSAHFIRALDNQRAQKKRIYGAGLILSEKAAAEKAAAEKAAAEKTAAVKWELSEREKAIILSLF